VESLEAHFQCTRGYLAVKTDRQLTQMNISIRPQYQITSCFV
jgi:hypothetical protein